MRALLSAYDKTGLEELARGLAALGWELVASGGTAAALDSWGLDHRPVESVTGAPEMLDGRVKTLHPAIHGGILADLSKERHRADLAARQITPISLVVCNLYPFTRDPSVELIDVGGPTMVRAAAKNYAHVGVVVDPADYGVVLGELRATGALGAATRLRLAQAAFAHTAAYDAAIAAWFAGAGGEGSATAEGGDGALPDSIPVVLEKAQALRYGENPHQQGARYRIAGTPSWWDAVAQHGGKELSYLNIFDADAAWALVHEILTMRAAAGKSAAVIVKHANACGAALGDSILDAYQRAFDCDPVSAFGGIVAIAGEVTTEVAAAILANAQADVLIAGSYGPGAVEMLAAKRKVLRILQAPAPDGGEPALRVRSLSGGLLVQEQDRFIAEPSTWRVVTKRVPEPSEWDDLELAWRVCGRTGSNAIVLAAQGRTVGVGAGQQNRKDAAAIAAQKAAGRAAGGAGASDAFFPFRDGLDAVVAAGVTAVVQPGGSIRDEEVVAAADEQGIAMVLTGERHFRH